MAELTVRIEGMHCGACVRRVGQALAALDGVVVQEVRVGAARVETAGAADPVLEAIAKAGFTPHLDA